MTSLQNALSKPSALVCEGEPTTRLTNPAALHGSREMPQRPTPSALLLHFFPSYTISLASRCSRVVADILHLISFTPQTGAPFARHRSAESDSNRRSPTPSSSAGVEVEKQARPPERFFDHHFILEGKLSAHSKAAATTAYSYSPLTVFRLSPLRFSRLMLTRLVPKTVLHPARPVSFTR